MDDSRQGAEIERLIAVIIRECEDWSDEDWSERKQSVGRLVEIGKSAVLPLIDALTPPSMGTELVIEALGKIRDTRAVEPLMVFLYQGNYENREAAATAIGCIGDVRVIEPLIASIRGRADSVFFFDEQQGVASALGRLGEPALYPLIRGLSDEDTGVREMSAYALGELRDARAVEPLIQSLTDRESGVRMDVATALSRIGDSRAIDPLVKCLYGSSKMVKIRVIRSLGYLTKGKGKVFLPLVALLDDPDVDIRWHSICALDANAGSEVIDLLLARLADADPCIRYAAVLALAGANDLNLVPKLEIVRDRDKGACQDQPIKDAATFAIQNIPKRHKAFSS